MMADSGRDYTSYIEKISVVCFALNQSVGGTGGAWWDQSPEEAWVRSLGMEWLQSHALHSMCMII